ncbi:flagellum-specific ATP synthase [Buchnera aphidicola (Cinara tujafilina)]|uniref:Flagellum-specific ATP synthase n=1 Tax=Buchnera aphidicola (Cinara tujafilina) TaxID=261317 RepID=F7WYY8_9GAMM|nr:flagellum-specific ATP synthase [Buchnera aphidicola (Cinara tujafilina)]
MCKKNKWVDKLNNIEKKINVVSNFIIIGYIISANNFLIEATGIRLPIGKFCFVENNDFSKIPKIICKIIGFSKKKIFLMPLYSMRGIFPGAKVYTYSLLNSDTLFSDKLPFSYQLLGRVLDSFGFPLDGFNKINTNDYRTIHSNPVNPLNRAPIKEIFDTGVCSINSLLTMGRGQRIGIFARAGVGKSMLLGMIARHSKVDIIIITLVGERGREVNEFINNILGPDSLKKSVVIVSSAGTSPLFRVQAVQYATSIAEYFCEKNNNVLLIVDSLTRYAMAYREISLSINEIPIAKGYPASIFSNIPQLIERTGNISKNFGSITAIYTVLTEGDEFNDPVLDIAKSILDGHIFLSNELADSGHYPAIDIQKSISRVMTSIICSQHKKSSSYIKKLISCYLSHKELIDLGAYSIGTNHFLDIAIKIWPILNKFLQQDFLEHCSYQYSLEKLEDLLKNI